MSGVERVLRLTGYAPWLKKAEKPKAEEKVETGKILTPNPKQALSPVKISFSASQFNHLV
jgi:hypothetical protein